IGFELSARKLEPLQHAHGKFTGIKYHRVTGKNEMKQVYVPAVAEEKARQHARHFIESCIERLKKADGVNAVLIAPFDAELFGHWWFEGPTFLEHVVRGAAEKGLPVITPADFLRHRPTLQVVQPASSSWGDGGFLDVWLDEKC